jgi:hypothetical protein
MKRDQILSKLEGATTGFTTSELVDQLGINNIPETQCAVEVLLLFSPEVHKDGQKWKFRKKGQKNKILAAIESYADLSGKKIFRLSAALSNLPAHEHPTEDQLIKILERSNGRFQLLRNAMIKRIS